MNTDKIYAESIAKEYAPKHSSKITALKKLDNKAKMPATIFTYTFGIAGTLILGVGMCLAMKVIGSGSLISFILGIIIGILGIIIIGLNYPLYIKLLNKGKKKYSFEIMQLAKEISEENKI
ncbi:MAG: dihydropteridine reductase [Ruminococcus sp.]|nr:dihydropteridine reductase [Ruminococcus sp.]